MVVICNLLTALAAKTTLERFNLDHLRCKRLRKLGRGVEQ